MAFRIYTKTGDQGKTSLFGGRRVAKSDLRIDAYGTVDELNSYLGLVRDLLPGDSEKKVLFDIQNRLFNLGSCLANDPEKPLVTPDVLEADLQQLETEIDRMDETLPALKNFILPGGHPTVSHLHIARTICRRAERLVVALQQAEQVDSVLIQYLNRLSDYLFVLARFAGQQLGAEEVVWATRKSHSGK